MTTEIDLVCGRNGDPNIWLIEAKDPVSVYGFAETARELRTFYSDSKTKGPIKPCYATQLSRPYKVLTETQFLATLGDTYKKPPLAPASLRGIIKRSDQQRLANLLNYRVQECSPKR
ncbi:hypothetical protein [Bifidobacterium subtile]|uniref:hypothetical protein n=1 Tax=Bifidobacterium subtile TaxID=77635 RepID=UPI00126A2786|nr:hypothetical protein [Bifidobacterium subtile]QOL36399.1 hypothetical protein BS3272_11325 [Bifidobacterium subtile]